MNTINFEVIDEILDVPVSQFSAALRRALRTARGKRLGEVPFEHDPKASSPPPALPGTQTLRRDLERCRRLGRKGEIAMAKRAEFCRARLRLAEAHGRDGELEREELARVIRAWVEGTAYSVLAVAFDFQNRPVPVEDIVAAGIERLYRATERFEWRRGIRFLSYANHWSAEAALTTVYDQRDTIRCPSHTQKAKRKLRLAMERGATLGEAAQEIGMSIDSARWVHALQLTTMSMSAPLDSDEEEPWAEMANTEDHVADSQGSEMRERISDELEILDEDQRQVLELRFGLTGKSAMDLDEIADELGMNPMSVGILERKALEALRGRGALAALV